MTDSTLAPLAPITPAVMTGTPRTSLGAPIVKSAPRKARKSAPVVVSFTTASLAVACKAPSAKDFRRWLRAYLDANGASDAKAGKGGRYAFTSAQGALIVKAYGERKSAAASHAAGETFERLARKARK